VKTKHLAAVALCIGLLAAFAAIIALNYGVLSPAHVQVGSHAWFIVLIAAFLTGYIDTCVGGGHGTLLTPVLILLGFAAAMVVPAILLSEICIGILATILNYRAGNIRLAQGEQHRRVLLVLAASSLVGSLIAVTVAVQAPPNWVNAYIGVVIMAVGILLLVGRGTPREFSMRRIAVLGTVAAFNKGLSGGGYGPLLTSGQILSGVGEKGAVSITPPARALTGLFAVSLYFAARGHLELNLAAPLIIGSLLAMPAAVGTVTWIEAAMLRKGITLATLVLGALLVIKAFRQSPHGSPQAGREGPGHPRQVPGDG
jgi:hypothetical protein